MIFIFNEKTKLVHEDMFHLDRKLNEAKKDLVVQSLTLKSQQAYYRLLYIQYTVYM